MRHSPTDRPTAIQQLAAASLAAAQNAAVHERVALHLLDWLGCAAQGAGTSAGQAAGRWLQMQGDGGDAARAHLAPAQRVPTLNSRWHGAASAALFHGCLGSALEMDDVHRSAILHPGPVVIPAALAAIGSGPPERASGAHLLGSIVAGYEAMIRVGQALGPTHYRLWHTTATAGCFGAAAAAAHAFGLDADRMAQALALAGTRAGGLWQVRHQSSDGKAWHMGGAARDGLAAAQAAACGMTGPLGVLDGPSGWAAATAPDADFSAIGMPHGMPLLCDVSFKPWPACRHAHPAMDALQQAAAGRELSLATVDRIEVFGYADALRFCDCVHPQNDAQARFSIPHALAVWVAWGAPQLSHYRGAALTDAGVAALRDRISLQVDAALQARFPQHYGARVAIHWRDGSRSEAELADTLGDPARPLSTAALQAKARMLMAEGGWSPARTDAALTACAALPRVTDLQALHQVICP